MAPSHGLLTKRDGCAPTIVSGGAVCIQQGDTGRVGGCGVSDLSKLLDFESWSVL